MVARACTLRLVRKFPRIAFFSPVEVICGGEAFTATSRNLSVGGMLLDARYAFPPGAELQVRFQLPTGVEVRAKARVAYCQPGQGAGIEFTRMESAHWHALEDTIQLHSSRGRLHARARLFVRLYWHEGHTVVVAPAETTLLSRYGCLLHSEDAPSSNSGVIIWCPRARRGISARVASRRQNPDGSFTMAAEFARDANVWNMELEAEDWRWISYGHAVGFL